MKIGNYSVVYKFQRGVYIAESDKPSAYNNGHVVLKTSEVEAGMLGMKHEHAVLTRFEHEDIVRLLEYIKDGETEAMALQLAGNKTLWEKMKEGFTEKDCLAILYGIAGVLGYLFDQKFSHCDLNPKNIVLRDEMYRPKLIDFQLAFDHTKFLKNPFSQKSGTPEYMAPEQHDYFVHPKTDLHPFGVIAHEMIFGARGMYGTEMAMQRKSCMWDVIGECTKKYPDQRPHPAEVRAVLQELLKQLGSDV